MTADSILKRHDEVGSPKPNSDIYKSLPVSNINIQPQPSNISQYIDLVGNGTQENRTFNADSGFSHVQTNILTENVNH